MKTEEKIKEILESIKPYLYADGGDLEFIKYENGYVYIKLLGICAGCDFADETIQNGILETLKQQIPEIKGVIKVDFSANQE
jgi:Fe-S cluster biogenesis protein NfuA